jgi:hypothetical protein
VCEPALCDPGYDLLPDGLEPHTTNEPPSREHWNETEAESVYVNAAACELVGFAGFTVKSGAGSAESASATPTATSAQTSAATSATLITTLLRLRRINWFACPFVSSWRSLELLVSS